MKPAASATAPRSREGRRCNGPRSVRKPRPHAAGLETLADALRFAGAADADTIGAPLNEPNRCARKRPGHLEPVEQVAGLAHCYRVTVDHTHEGSSGTLIADFEQSVWNCRAKIARWFVGAKRRQFMGRFFRSLIQ
jgi:hypothetical protein